jgi:mono/diheme cytochrome c family protein
MVAEPTAYNIGQWGLTQDDYGKPWFVQAGLEAGPVNFEMPILYGQSELEGKFTPGFMDVWPLVATMDYQGGPVRVRETDKTLNHFTATCGPDIFRGDRLPPDLRGDLLFCEPVGRLIRRAKVNIKEGFTTLINPYESQKSEFIRSTDPNFRPVNLVTAPDGTLYIVDMYHGIIQESAWTAPGSYLRGVILEHGMDKNIGRGRIWRLVHEDFPPGQQPSFLNETPAQLVAHLEHPNGWWRDNAQKLLVLRQDKSVAPALARMADSNTNPLARIHALWTLEGLDAVDSELLRKSLTDSNPQVRATAIRVAESVTKLGDALMPELLGLVNDPDPAVVLQLLMTSTRLKWPESSSLITSALSTNQLLGVQKIAPVLAKSVTPQAAPEIFTEAEKAQLHRGEQIYQQLCFSCHGPDGKGAPLAGAPAGTTMAPSLAGAPLVVGPRDGVINLVLKGLDGPVDGKKYTALMVPMQGSDDAWIAAVISYIRNSFGNSASLVETNDVARLRGMFTERTAPWTVPELLTTLPEALGDRSRWKVTASHNEMAAALAIDGDGGTRFDTRAGQVPGMWFEIMLSADTLVSGILLDSGAGSRDYARGYEVTLSADGRTWGQPVAAGHGTGALTEIVFPPATAKYIRVTQTSRTPGHYWSIQEIQVYKPAPPIPRSILAKKATPSVFE